MIDLGNQKFTFLNFSNLFFTLLNLADMITYFDLSGVLDNILFDGHLFYWSIKTTTILKISVQ